MTRSALAVYAGLALALALTLAAAPFSRQARRDLLDLRRVPPGLFGYGPVEPKRGSD